MVTLLVYPYYHNATAVQHVYPSSVVERSVNFPGKEGATCCQQRRLPGHGLLTLLRFFRLSRPFVSLCNFIPVSFHCVYDYTHCRHYLSSLLNMTAPNVASVLCCTALERTLSPPTPNARLARDIANKRSMDKMNNHKTRLGSLDELELNKIFIAASLPDDHPHAVKFSGRKAGLNDSIIRSPTLANKLKKQLSRKSLASSKSLRSLKAHSPRLPYRKRRDMGKDLTIDELLADDSVNSNDYDPDAQLLQSRIGSIERVTGPLHLPKHTRPSILPSFQWLAPQTDGLVSKSACDDCADISSDETATPETLDGSDPFVCGSVSLKHQAKRSISMPDFNLPINGSSGFQRALVLPSNGSGMYSVAEDSTLRIENLGNHREVHTSTDESVPSSLDVVEKIDSRQLYPATASKQSQAITDQASALVVERKPLLVVNSPADIPQLDGSANLTFRHLSETQSQSSIHLYNMNIRERLRSQSRPSEVSSLGSTARCYPRVLNLNSVLPNSTRSRNDQQSSSEEIPSSNLSSARRAALLDNASSIYSRSASHGSLLESRHISPVDLPYDIPYSGPSRQDVWPSTEETSCLSASPQKESELEPITEQICPSNRSVIHTPATDQYEWSRPHVDGTMDQSSAESPLLDTDSTSSTRSIATRFRQSLALSTSIKRVAKKHRSLLQLLRPSRIKAQTRSFSTPLLVIHPLQHLPPYDGSADQSSSTMPTTPQPGIVRIRSVSFSGLPSGDMDDIRLDSGGPPSLKTTTRRQTLADYERKLTMHGDNRRHKSIFSLNNLQQVQAEDRQDSFARPLHRASPLFGPKVKGENTLMEKALKKHAQEKAALFRVNVKKPEVVAEPSIPAPIFNSPFSPSAQSTSARMVSGLEDVDPLQAAGPYCLRPTQSMLPMRRPASMSAVASGKTPSAMTKSTESSKGTMPRLGRGLPLASWSRYPSHNRLERTASAGVTDDVRTRDFAYGENGQPTFASASSGDTSRSAKSHKKQNWLSKSHSATIGTVWRYYHSMFTSSAAQNRRSSISVSGKLKHPELEMLGPILPEHHHHIHGFDNHSHSTPTLGHYGAHGMGEAHEMQSMIFGRPHPRSSSSAGPSISKHDGSDADDEPTREALEPNLKAKAMQSDAALRLDGAVEAQARDEPIDADLATQWSAFYQSCVRLPSGLDVEKDNDSIEAGSEPRVSHDSGCATQFLGSSPRSGAPSFRLVIERPKTSPPSRMASAPLPGPAVTGKVATDPTTGNVMVRRFPSVTVIDDRKGHWRSISLVSVGSSGVRSSTNDLIDLMMQTEEAGRKKFVKIAEDFRASVLGKEVSHVAEDCS